MRSLRSALPVVDEKNDRRAKSIEPADQSRDSVNNTCLAFTAVDNIALAAPTATIVMSTTTPQVGKPIIFDGSSSICDYPTGCGYTWQWFWRSTDGTTTHLGGQMGRTPIVAYTFDAFAASKPYVFVTLTVGGGRVQRSSTAQVAFVVSPPDKILSLAPVGGSNVVLSLSGVEGRSYQVQVTPTLSPPAWQTIGAAVPGQNGLGQFTDTNSWGRTQRYYRFVWP